METFVGDIPGISRTLLDAVVQAAAELGRDVLSDDLFLLALARLDVTEPARRVLAAEGVDVQRLLPELRAGSDGSAEAVGDFRFPPAHYMMLGRAQGFAAALGDGRVLAQHVLLAAIWDPMSASSHVVRRLGAQRERIVARLQELGALVPAAAPPAERPVEFGEPVGFRREDTSKVIQHARRSLPAGTEWTVGGDDERGWIRAEAHVDVEPLVLAATAPERP